MTNTFINFFKKYNINPHKIYIVGGYVRDLFLNEILSINTKSNDIDLVLEMPTKKDLEILDKNFEKVGNDFPVYLVNINGNNYELALARKERKKWKGYKGFEFEFNENITIHDDLYRRDITINSMAMNIATGKIIDPFNGQEDIKNKIIRHVSEHFAEDPLRILRVARFSSRFNFSIHNNTLKLMKKISDELKYLSKERIYLEIEKTFKQSKNPSDFFKKLKYIDFFNINYNEIDIIDKLNIIDNKFAFLFRNNDNGLKFTAKQKKIIKVLNSFDIYHFKSLKVKDKIEIIKLFKRYNLLSNLYDFSKVFEWNIEEINKIVNTLNQKLPEYIINQIKISKNKTEIKNIVNNYYLNIII